MKKMLFTIVLSIMCFVGYSTELPKVSKFKEAPITLESWMLKPFVFGTDAKLSITGIAKNGEEYKIHLSEDVYHYNGINYDVYIASYDDETIKIGVHKDSFIVLCKDVIVFYKYKNKNFGVYKILFSNPIAQKSMNYYEYQKQSELGKEKLNTIEFVNLIVENFPLLKTNMNNV